MRELGQLNLPNMELNSFHSTIGFEMCWKGFSEFFNGTHNILLFPES